MGTFPRGSEWRRWDLQIHTPFSALNHHFGTDFERYATNLLQRALAADVAAVGITDYFLIDGYKSLRAFLSDGAKLRALLGSESADQALTILVLPNIELRSSVVVRDADGADSRVNFHVVFSDLLEPGVIEEHFLRELKFTAEARPGARDESWSLTRDNLEALGKKLKKQHAAFRDRSDLVIGMTNAVVRHEDVTTVLEQQGTRFKDRYLIIVPADEDLSRCRWDGQGHLVRKLLIQKAHMLFSANEGTREFGLGRKHPSVKDFLNEFKTLKPCVHGSDSHSYEDLFEPAGKRYLWLKADPTYEGLRQLLYEPEKRVYVGEIPPALQAVRQNATKYMESVSFDRTEAAQEGERWFSGPTPLNNGLIAIIGNKGSGKSALADILALLGNTHSGDFSFLNQERFLTPTASLGLMFSAQLVWCSGTRIRRRLGEPTDVGAPEVVKYIPQSYLETICSELKQSSETAFDRELREVIFSHVTEADRLRRNSLGDLITYRTKEKEQRISQLISELAAVNADIIALEERTTPEHRRGIEAQLALKRLELTAHDAAKPSVVPEPRLDPNVQQTTRVVAAEVETLERQIETREKALAELRERLRESTEQTAAADKLLSRLANLERQLGVFYAESAEDGRILGLDIKRVVSLAIDREPVSTVRGAAVTQSASATAALAPNVRGSLAAQQAEAKATIEQKRVQLDEPTKRYQTYLQGLASWKRRREAIVGSPGGPESVLGLEATLNALDALPAALDARCESRAALVRDIFLAKEELLSAYRRLYSPVQAFIDQHPISKGQGGLQFFASMSVEGLVDGLLNLLHQGRKGSFQGDEEGRRRLGDLVAASDFSTMAGVEAFQAAVQDHLLRDKRDDDNRPVRIKEQLRQGVSVGAVYDLLYGLSYLRPRFELRWQRKRLDQLSPGERGTLLLVFYLLIDKRDAPLIIDQPEENLDNQTIATMLVPAIKEAKERRQIIIVTHNPNLAVVCDAEQVIHARLDKADGNRITYTSGAIEDPAITQLIVDVLEGTMPAFDLRDAKYGVLERLDSLES